MRGSAHGISLAIAIALAVTAAVTAAADPPKPSSRPPQRTANARRPPPQVYKEYVKRWHEPRADVDGAPLDGQGRAKLVLVSLNTNDRVELEAATDRGGFSASDLDRAAFVLREAATGNEHPVEPHLLDLVYRIQRHFEAQELRVISGYRTPHAHRGSNHGRGRAIDIVVPGATDLEVAKFARELGFVGVGIYPSSGFVHVDVRDRSYFWVDASAPGRRNRERGILGDLAAKSDAAAAARGEHGVGPFNVASDVEATLAQAHSHADGAPGANEDDDDEDDAPVPLTDG
jgi:uncharacterized protein YcbK (DUF882 family)